MPKKKLTLLLAYAFKQKIIYCPTRNPSIFKHSIARGLGGTCRSSFKLVAWACCFSIFTSNPFFLSGMLGSSRSFMVFLTWDSTLFM